MSDTIEPVFWVPPNHIDYVRQNIVFMVRASAQEMSGDVPVYTADALEQARKKGWKAGLEEAAKACDLEFAANWTASAMAAAKQAKRCADAIRALKEKP